MIHNIAIIAIATNIYMHLKCAVTLITVESGLDDPVGHFFGGSSGSHPQTKLSECDPDITCSLENSVGIW